MIGELIARLRRPDSWVEMTEEGFSVMTKRLFLRPWKKSVAWQDVQQIDGFLWDCYNVHRLGLAFIPQSGKPVHVDDLDSNWQSFLDEVVRRFPGFDLVTFKKVEGFFPNEGSLTCWKKGAANQALNRTVDPGGSTSG